MTRSKILLILLVLLSPFLSGASAEEVTHGVLSVNFNVHGHNYPADLVVIPTNYTFPPLYSETPFERLLPVGVYRVIMSHRNETFEHLVTLTENGTAVNHTITLELGTLKVSLMKPINTLSFDSSGGSEVIDSWKSYGHLIDLVPLEENKYFEALPTLHNTPKATITLPAGKYELTVYSPIYYIVWSNTPSTSWYATSNYTRKPPDPIARTIITVNPGDTLDLWFYIEEGTVETVEVEAPLPDFLSYVGLALVSGVFVGVGGSAMFLKLRKEDAKRESEEEEEKEET